ncbi:MAG: YncE family protein, partial [Rhodospirillaceae bacterium]|nr:YncE family protein [Rhodospirillaceae bacterium]
FARADDGLDVFLYDTETDEIVGGVRDEDLGGSSYTSYTDGEFIYILMQPAGYGPRGMDAFVGASSMNVGRLTTMRPFWVARVNPDTWEVEQEYPYPGYRGDWIVIDSASEYMYVPAGGSSSVTKIDIETGEIAWHAAAGIGPYGATLNADESEIWVADKGETTGFMGRTVTVLDTASGRGVETVFAGYMIDHVLLAPNGREVWGTSNAEGVLYVFDTATREQMATIEMPGYGDAHGLVWVHYDENGDGRVVRDQGGFHGGLDPAEGIFLDY